ncbi:uncharacterized protein FTJAE_1093 [Fusarium tjaetaba]|uniref:Uncharacterized protein n=1 Tax=Fusarium tjaetaba TaxID=1567544 RepID=A0A8H5W4T4_9HYPO|nr:uncharacterized protein FTJAE_1093 [Fusarium tjaetaba]KAF5649097.1 hypothetical protein FTJAE_1093 [Fusarium tjaetaba]
MGREEMQNRLKELETEKSVLEWALEASLHEKDVDTDNEDNKSETLSTYTMADLPASDPQVDEPLVHVYPDGPISDSESSISLHSTDSLASTMARIKFTATMPVHQVVQSDPASYRYDGTGMSEDGREDEETICGSTTGIEKEKEKEASEDTSATDPNSPFNITNPHPTLSISTKFLQKAIFHSRQAGSPFLRSFLHRKPVDGKAGEYTEWKWIPFLVFGAAAELVAVNIGEGDIEVICMKDTRFTTMIQKNKNMFEEPGSLGAKSALLDEFKPAFNGPEAWGFRVLVWRVHSSEKTVYMDRHGHPVPGEAGTLAFDGPENWK